MIKISQPQVSAVGTTNLTITRPFRANGNVMAEVVVGAGSGTVSVQFQGSNDGTNYTAIGSAVTSTDRDVALSPNGEVYLYYRAVVTVSTDTKATDVAFYFA